MLGRFLVGAAVAWPLVAGGALWQRVVSPSATPTFAAIVYAAAGRICHQRPERSFHTHDVAWPVCARCAGLYLAAPFAALVAFRRRAASSARSSGWFSSRSLVTMAAIPTALTLLWEWGGLGTPPNVWRFATALPLGAAIAFVLVATVTERQPSQSIG